MKNKQVEVIEIWETEGGGKFVSAKRPVAMFVNGVMIQLFDGFYAEKRMEDELIINNKIKNPL